MLCFLYRYDIFYLGGVEYGFKRSKKRNCKKQKKQYTFWINSSLNSARVLKWISYVPDFWNIEEIVNKKSSEVNENEIELLKRFFTERSFEVILRRYIASKEAVMIITEEEFEICRSVLHRNFMKDMYNLKLNEKEKQMFIRLISEFNNGDDTTFINLEQKPIESRSLVEDFFVYKARDLIRQKEVEELNKGIEAELKKNRCKLALSGDISKYKILYRS